MITTETTTSAIAMLSMSHRFIVAPLIPGERRLYTVFSMLSAPASTFDAWLSEQLRQHQFRRDAKFTAIYAAIARTRWRLFDRWRILNELCERGVMLPLYSSREQAQAAIDIMQTWERQGQP